MLNKQVRIEGILIKTGKAISYTINVQTIKMYKDLDGYVINRGIILTGVVY